MQKKRGKLDSDDDFVPGKKANGRKAKGRGQNKSSDQSADSDATDEIDEMFEPETEEEVLHFSNSSSSEDQLDSDGSEYVPRGRNAKRAAAIKRKSNLSGLESLLWLHHLWRLRYFVLAATASG
jgi:hypothetical protein